MDEEIERLTVSVRADTAAFAGDVRRMRAELDGPLGEGAQKAGRALETSLARALRTGSLGFDDLEAGGPVGVVGDCGFVHFDGVGEPLRGGGSWSAGTNC